MSRGLGKIELAVKEYLARVSPPRNVREIAMDLSGKPEPTRASVESVRRACKSLERKGLGVTGYRTRRGKRVLYFGLQGQSVSDGLIRGAGLERGILEFLSDGGEWGVTDLGLEFRLLSDEADFRAIRRALKKLQREGRVKLRRGARRTEGFSNPDTIRASLISPSS